MGRRTKEFAKEAIGEYPEIIFQDPELFKKRLQEESKPLVVEFGMGTGIMLVELAQRNPEILYIGIEVKEERCWRMAKKASEEKLSNIICFCGYLDVVLPILEKQQLQELWVTFADPWPKARHEKRRMVNRKTLPLLAPMVQAGILSFKTDHPKLFHYTHEILLEQGWTTEFFTEDLHTSNFEPKIITAFEARFIEKGLPIYLLQARPPK